MRSLKVGLYMSVALIGAAAMPALGQAPQTTADARAEAASPRRILSLAAGWRFRFGGDAAGVTDPAFDDSQWEPVAVPHSWNRMGEYQQTRSAGSNLEQGVGWYRLALAAPARARGQRQILQFDGVGAIAEVWVNGARIGSHEGGFSTFRFDVTDQLRPGAANSIVVKADNSKPGPGSSAADVIPLGGDFFVHGGLYRGVSLMTVDAAQFDTRDFGGPGIYLTTPQVTDAAATVSLLARLRNAGTGRRALTMTTRVLDADGTIVARDSAPVALTTNGTLEVRRALTIARPRLWQGRADPYLYRVVAELVDGGRVVDRVEQPLGVRTFAFDPARGFILNGKPTRLHGASRHQDRQGKGWALGPQDHEEDMAIMAEMGVNTVRQAHYQHAQEWSDAADKTGMVVEAEVPFVHQSAFGEGLPTAALLANAKTQLTELIRQNYNHPSIMIWSVGNEIDIGAAIDALRQGGKGAPAKSRDMLIAMNTLAKAEDPSRPTSYADCCDGTPSPLARPGAQKLNDVTDVIGLNRYFGWYYGKPGDAATTLAAMHARYPDRAITLTEYGAGGALSQHTDNPLGGPVNANGRPHPEEFQSWVHEETWKVLQKQEYLAASWIWNMFDFASNSREEGEAIDLNDKGLVSYDRTIRKDAFYFYKASWTDVPVLHLNGRRYADRAYPVMDVRAYSNAETASLSVNGREIGAVPCPDRICIWPAVALQPGENAVTAKAVVGGQKLEDTVTWTAPDAAKGLRIRVGSLTGLTSSTGVRFGSDNFFVGGTVPEMPMGARGKPAEIHVDGTLDPALFSSYRQGNFGYDLPLPDGQWTVTLHMYEPDATKAASRSFDVAANGRTMLTKFNPAQAAGGPMKAVTRAFPVRVTGGTLSLRFTGVGGEALVSAISVEPKSGGAAR